MKSFSLRRVAHYARYHYTVTRLNYFRLIVAVLVCPVLFGMLNKSIFTSASILVAIYLFAGISVAVACTHSMRDRGMKIMDGLLPVSATERFVFNVLNLSVVYPVAFAAVSAATLAIVAPFSEFLMSFGECYKFLLNEALLLWPVYVFVQIVCSMSLLINLLARRSLILAYVITFVGFVALLCLLVCGLNWLSLNVELDLSFNPNEFMLDTVEVAAKVVYCMVPVVLYIIGYVVLRRRQVKW